MSPRRRRTQARFRIALGDNLQLHLFAEATPSPAIDNLKSFHSALSVLTSIRTVSARSDSSYKAAHLGCVRLADNDPSFESVLSKKPDLITVQFQWQVGPEGVVAKPEQFEELGIPVYTSPSDCVGKENSAASDGVRHQVGTGTLLGHGYTVGMAIKPDCCAAADTHRCRAARFRTRCSRR